MNPPRTLARRGLREGHASPAEFYTAEALEAHRQLDRAGVPRETTEGDALSMSQRVEWAVRLLLAQSLR